MADHHWHTPDVLETDPSIHVQAVVMGEWDPESGGRKDSTVTANAVSYETGLVMGAVGLRDGAAARPHVGFYIDAQTLLWVVLESQGVHPVYSVYWERASGAAYTIEGVGFAWDRASSTVRNVAPKRGDRAHTLPESALEAVPTRLPGRLDFTGPDNNPNVSRP